MPGSHTDGPAADPTRPDPPTRSGEPEHYLATELFERVRSTRELVAFLENGSLDGMWIWDLEHPEHVWMTDRFRALLGYGDVPVEGADFMRDSVDPGDAVLAEEAFHRHLADPAQPYDQVLRYRHRDGSTVWVRSRGFAIRDDAGVPVRFVGVHTDLSDAMRTQEALAESLESLAAYSAVLQQIDGVTVALQQVTEPDEVVASLARFLGREVGELAMVVEPTEAGGFRLAAVDSPDPFRVRVVEQLFRDEPISESDESPVSTVIRTGEPLLIQDVAGPALLNDLPEESRPEVAAYLPTSVVCLPWARSGDRWGAVMVARFDPERPLFVERDLTLVRQVLERHESTRRQLRAQQERQAVERFRELARAAPMAILQIDDVGNCTFANDRWAQLTGQDGAASLGHGWVSVFPVAELERLREAWVPARSNGEVLSVETRIRHTDGGQRWVGGSSVAQFDESGTYTGALIAISDITARKAAEEELTRRARQDPLTRTANRYALFEHVDAGLERVKQDHSVMGLLYLDLDTFKEVNDSLGHEVGDQLLAGVALRLQGVLRDSDLCARVGGDEFVLLLDDVGDRLEAGRVAQRICDLLAPPFHIAGLTVGTSVSIGVATVSSDDGVLWADELLRRADLAMYRAKDAGRNRWEVYDRSMDERARSEAALREEIEAALDDGHLVLHYQPIVALGSLAVVGVEALVRIQHPTRGLVPPGDFLDAAERSGQIVRIGQWVVEEACRQLGRWHAEHPDLYLTLNLSGRQIADVGAADLVLDRLAAHGVPTANLIVELTETTLVRATGAAAIAVQRLQDAGVRLAIDDFGTGYSSLARLAELPADMIKIDRSFVEQAPDNPMNAAIIAAVLHLADRMDLDVVAEGIETPLQLRTVAELGCTVGQGFLFSRPVPAAEVEDLLRGAFVTHG